MNIKRMLMLTIAAASLLIIMLLSSSRAMAQRESHSEVPCVHDPEVGAQTSDESSSLPGRLGDAQAPASRWRSHSESEGITLAPSYSGLALQGPADQMMLQTQPVTQTLVESETVGLDIVFLIDNSSSMYRETSITGTLISEIGHDEDFLRLKSVRYVVNRLLFYNQRLNPGATHRVGVITFGGLDRSTVDIALEPLATDTDEARELLYEHLSAKLAEDDRGSTHPIEAITQTVKLWKDNPWPESQVKAIILLTDGRPSITEINGVPAVIKENGVDTWNPKFYEVYFGELRKVLDAAGFRQASSPGSTDGYHLWIVAIGSDEDFAPVRWRWEQIVGKDHWRQISSASSIPATFDDIMENTYPLGNIIQPGNFAMLPYLDAAAFSILASAPLGDTDVVFYRQDGSQLLCSPEDGVYCLSIGDTIRWIEVRRPQPGTWKYEKRRADLEVKVRFDPLFGQMQLVEPAGIQSQLGSTRIAYQLLDKNGEPIEEQQGFPLILEGTLLVPGGAAPIPLRFAPGDKGLYASSSLSERQALSQQG